MADPERYTLDTSAFIAYFADEPGADRVEELLRLAGSDRVEVYASFMTYMETLYRLWRDRGEKEGKLTYLRLKSAAGEAGGRIRGYSAPGGSAERRVQSLRRGCLGRSHGTANQ